MKKFTKILSVVLCLALVLTAFAACGGKEDATTAPGETSAPAATDTDKTIR